VLVFPDDEFKALSFFWVPEEGARRREHCDRVPYLRWANQGLIEMTPGEVVDYDVVRRRINELGERFQIRELAIDRWNATQLAGQLEQDGFEVVAFGQGYSSMNFPTKKLEEQRTDRRHRGADYGDRPRGDAAGGRGQLLAAGGWSAAVKTCVGLPARQREPPTKK
jgi:phage terminase large subunit-like protein